MKNKLLKMLEAKNAARAKAISEMAKTDDKEVRASQLELINSIEEEITKINEILAEAKDEENPLENPLENPPADEQRSGNLDDPELIKRADLMPVGGLIPLENQRAQEIKKENEELEKRGADLRAGKTIVVRAASLPIKTSDSIITEKKYSRELAQGLNEVSSLVDTVNSVPLQGGESYTKGFAISGDEGGYTAEGADATDIEPTMGYVEIPKSKITAYTEITEEIKKLPNIDYATYIEGEVRKAIRKKITKQIIAGAGTTNTLTGIYNGGTTAMPTASDLEVIEIDSDTLSDIVFGYGGDEDVEESATLVLSKADLRAFAKVKFDDGRKAYKITKNGNTGTIEEADGGVAADYIINSACNSLSATATAAGAYTMVYGRPSAYELPIFSDIEIKESSDYKFKSGNIAFRGVVFLGGNVAAYKGWMRIKKKAAAAG